MFGDHALIQRCTLHKRRNVADHLPKSERGWVDQRLARAFNHADADSGLRQARDLARQLEVRWPDAAASLREGLEDMWPYAFDWGERVLMRGGRGRLGQLTPPA